VLRVADRAGNHFTRLLAGDEAGAEEAGVASKLIATVSDLELIANDDAADGLVDLAAELGLEGGISLPAGEGVGMNLDGGCGSGDGVACEEKAGGGELVGAEGFG